MYFGYLLPWWAALLLVIVAALVGYLSYRGLTPRLRHAGDNARRPARAMLLLSALRAATVLILLLVLFRPLLGVSDRGRDPRIVPVLVDQSRSMRIADADGQRRIDGAREMLRPLLARLGKQFRPEVFGFGAAVAPTDLEHLKSADQPATDIEGALRAVRGRYQGRNVAGILVVSDGAETESPVATSGADTPTAVRMSAPPVAGPPVFAIGVGSTAPDREVRSVTASREPLNASLVDLDALVSSRGLGDDPFDVRLVTHGATTAASADDGRVVDVRHVTPVDGAPMHVTFSVPPDAVPTLYTVEVPADAREAVVENNRAAVILTPPARKRRVLFVQGAPGFEHSFLRRAWSDDPAVEVDSVVRKGKNDQGVDAYFIQADPARAPALLGGYPTTKAGLFVYDAIVFASVEWDFLTRDQMAMTADFVRERGGGVLVLGARSFAAAGLAGTPLDAALPLERAAGKPAVALTSAEAAAGSSPGDTASRSDGRPARNDENRLRLTAQGRDDAIMRVAPTAAESEREWASLPALAATNVVGPPRPGASVLAVASVGGAVRPVLAVQRYGRGRTAEFTGEGSWRWKMLMPATDRTHEMFWRQVLRWMSATAPDPVTIAATDGAQPGTSARVDVLVADGEFQPVANARVNVRITVPSGEVRTATATLADGATGRYSARIAVPAAGVYHVETEARRGPQALGTADQWFVAGANDPETADPRLNEEVLQRISSGTHGRYLALPDLAQLPALLAETAASDTVTRQPRDIWQHPLVFALLIGLLGAEWALRRRWGFA